MSEISFNSIFDGVSLALHAAFPDRQIHGGCVEQGLMPGDFNVILPGAGLTREVGQRQRRSPTVDVIYYPKGGAAEWQAKTGTGAVCSGDKLYCIDRKRSIDF